MSNPVISIRNPERNKEDKIYVLTELWVYRCWQWAGLLKNAIIMGVNVELAPWWGWRRSMETVTACERDSRPVRGPGGRGHSWAETWRVRRSLRAREMFWQGEWPVPSCCNMKEYKEARVAGLECSGGAWYRWGWRGRWGTDHASLWAFWHKIRAFVSI